MNNNVNIFKKYLLQDHSVRLQTVTLEDTWHQILAHNALPDTLQHLMGELVIAAVLMTGNIKFKGSLILQIQSKGVVSLAAVECTHDLKVRASIRYQHDIPIPNDFHDLFDKDSYFVLTLDIENRPEGTLPYQSIIPLPAKSVAHALSTYMRFSEQLDTKFYFAVNAQRLSGLMLQRMPHHGGQEVDEQQATASWERLCLLANTIKAEEQLNLPEPQWMNRLFWEETLLCYPEHPVTFSCSCSLEKVQAMLSNLGQEALKSMLNDLPTIDVNCEFCGKHYHLDATQTQQLLHC